VIEGLSADGETDVMLLRRDPGWRLVFEQDGVLVFRRVSASRPAAPTSAAPHPAAEAAAAAGTPARR